MNVRYIISLHTINIYNEVKASNLLGINNKLLALKNEFIENNNDLIYSCIVNNIVLNYIIIRISGGILNGIIYNIGINLLKNK